MPVTLALQAVTPAALAARLGMPLGDARKIVSAVHRRIGLDAPIQGVRRTSLEAARAQAIPALKIVSRRASAVDPFVKLALETHDAHVIETVRIPLEREGRFSVCV